MSRQLFRCAVVAEESRGDQARGTEMIRPSDSVTCRASSVQITWVASGSTVRTEMLIPLTYNLITPIFNDLPYLGQLGRIHPKRFHESYRRKPELGILLSGFNMHVGRLSAFETEEEKAITAITENFGHCGRLSLQNRFRIIRKPRRLRQPHRQQLPAPAFVGLDQH